MKARQAPYAGLMQIWDSPKHSLHITSSSSYSPTPLCLAKLHCCPSPPCTSPSCLCVSVARHHPVPSAPHSFPSIPSTPHAVPSARSLMPLVFRLSYQRLRLPRMLHSSNRASQTPTLSPHCFEIWIILIPSVPGHIFTLRSVYD
ncbi:hypothetical protein E2C01_078680 [Portunus trituberculatus]|uniref:Uncharacterized protein n=1 Tax=Portunus trituberculatus TaxID=210409 RepID=A0A5B7IQV4_PORTR|nr:hypothetical protein [Portunus trituberculatus]